MADDALVRRMFQIINDKLDKIAFAVGLTLAEGAINMSFSSEILDAVTAETTAVDSVLALINASPTMSQAEKDNIITAITAERVKVEAALTANVTPPAPLAP